MAPSSSGGITVGEALNILSRFDLSKQNRTRALFEYLEASRLAFADRGAYIGDAAYVPVPQSGLLDPDYAATRSCLIKDTALTSPVAPGSPYAPYGGLRRDDRAGGAGPRGDQHQPPRRRRPLGQRRQLHQHHRAARRQRNHPSRQGIPAQQRDDRLRLRAGSRRARTTRTSPAPGKRPRSSMSPTIVLKDGAFDFALGSPGGSTIITTVLQVLLNHVDFGMSLPDAIAAPRVSQRNTTTSLAEPAFYDSEQRHRLRDALRRAVHRGDRPGAAAELVDRQRHRDPAPGRRLVRRRRRAGAPARRQRPGRPPRLLTPPPNSASDAFDPRVTSSTSSPAGGKSSLGRESRRLRRGRARPLAARLRRRPPRTGRAARSRR